MAKLLPPYIEGKLPAQDNVTKISIPYKLNRAVGYNDFNCMIIKLRDVSTNIEIGEFETTSYANGNAIFIVSNGEKPLLNGHFYKAQLAFANRIETAEGEKFEIGFYSTVGVFKCGAPGECKISNLVENVNNIFPFFLRGTYLPASEDPMEKAYSYRFCIYRDGILIEDSGELFDSYYEIKMLPEKGGSNYKIQLNVLTVNGFTSRITYTATKQCIDSGLSLQIESIREKGSNNISCNNQITDDQTGNYKLLAQGSSGLVRHIGNFYFKSGETPNKLVEDYGLADGETYKYFLYKYDNFGRPLTETSAVAPISYFDDLFLTEGNKQYCIRYNPQVSSFKTTLLESKQDTLGSKYPFFFRSDIVGYKEFSIGGLISRLGDYEENNKEREKTNSNDIVETSFSTNLTSENFAEERKYKLELLDWLNNGHIKLFRSPAEGNYYVRLMNVSLSPNTTLGRMLHTFTATAYEVADINKNIFNASKIIYESKGEEQRPSPSTDQHTFSNENSTIILPVGAYWFRYTGLENDELSVTYADGTNEVFKIGYTGILEAAVSTPIIRFASFNKGELEYNYYTNDNNNSLGEIHIIEYYNADTELLLNIELPNGTKEITLYCDEQTVIDQAQNKNEKGDYFYYIKNDSNDKVFLGAYDNDTPTAFHESGSNLSKDELNSLSIGAGVRVRVYVNDSTIALESFLQSAYGELLTTKNGLYLVCQEGSPNL